MLLNLDSVPLPVLAIKCGLGLWATAALLVFFTGAKAKHLFYSILLFIGGSLVGLAAALSYGQKAAIYDFLPFCYFGVAPFSIRIDGLICFFIGIVAVTVCALAIFSPAYLNKYKDRLHPGIYWHCIFVFVLALTLTFLSTNAISFLVFWETMSLAAMSLIASDHVRQRARHAALIYLGMTAISTVLLFASFLYYYRHFHSWDFSNWHAAGSLILPALLLFCGLAVKSGIWPFHIWMAYAQAEAPSPVTALMSTIMKLAGIYALIRLLIVDNNAGLILAYIALALGTVSIIWGSLFALLEHDLKRMLSYSSVENIGLIIMALALCLMGRYFQQWNLAALALIAALFHSLNHSLCKAGLFVGAGGIEATTHTRDLAFLGGLVKRMPWTTACFLANGLSAVALPPFNGFASKWMIYQCLFALAMSKAQVFDRGLSLTLVGILALVSALSLACYTKAIGIGFLGRARSEAINHVGELSIGTVLVQIFFAVSCLLLGLMAPYVTLFLHPICAEVLPEIGKNANQFDLPLVYITVLGSFTTLGLITFLFVWSKRPEAGLRKYVTWDCGYGNLPTRAEETGTSFSESIARIFAPILRYRMITEIQGKDRRHFPEAIKFETVTSPLLEGLIYQPTMKLVLLLSKAIGGLQTGSIHLYLLYVFMTLLVLVGLSVKL